MEALVLERVNECVMVQLDGLRRGGPAIDDSRSPAGATQPTARATAFAVPWKRGELVFHGTHSTMSAAFQHSSWMELVARGGLAQDVTSLIQEPQLAS